MQALHRGVGGAAALSWPAAPSLLSGVAMVAMVGIVAWGVFGRFVLNDTPAWAEASALLLLGWVILGAAAAGVREGFHMGFDTLRDVLPAPITRLFSVLSDLVVTIFGLAMACLRRRPGARGLGRDAADARPARDGGIPAAGPRRRADHAVRAGAAAGACDHRRRRRPACRNTRC